MIYALCLYAALMLLIGMRSWRHMAGQPSQQAFREFVVAGGRQGTCWITLSLLATIIGSSATFGSMGLSATVGFASFWWLGAGAVGLTLQALLLADKVRDLGAHTLPHVAHMVMGRPAALLTSLFIAISWVGIVAAQFTALAQLVNAVPGLPHTQVIIPVMGALIIFYTAAGGQLSVIRTDAVQFLLIAAGIGLACMVLFAGEDFSVSLWLSRVELLNTAMGPADVLGLLCIVGGAYFVGPDIFSRNLAAKDGACARRSMLWAAGLLLCFGLCMAWMGAWAAAHQIARPGENPLVALMARHLPAWLSGLLGLGLISALVSSADTCLMSAASILENDVLQRRSIGRTRLFVLLAGGLALLLAMARPDIIGLLMVAYSLYVPGVVLPLAVGILCHQRRAVCCPLLYAGMVSGGLCGLAGNMTQIPYLPLAGMGLSLIFSLAAVCVARNKELVPHVLDNVRN